MITQKLTKLHKKTIAVFMKSGSFREKHCGFREKHCDFCEKHTEKHKNSRLNTDLSFRPGLS